MKGIAFEAQLCYNGKNGGANMKNDHSFFQNSQCEYFPCHKVKDPESFNCLFCYCPMYFLEDCGGDASYTKKGVKDCSACLRIHAADSWTFVQRRLLQEIKRIEEEHTNKENT